jgi:hypothetical protein
LIATPGRDADPPHALFHLSTHDLLTQKHLLFVLRSIGGCPDGEVESRIRLAPFLDPILSVHRLRVSSDWRRGRRDVRLF